MDIEWIIVFITTPKGDGSRIARYIVENRLAACVNIVTGVRSLYWWEGKVNDDEEDLLIVKTRMSLLSKLIEGVKSIHPYSVPEIIALPIIGGNMDYLRWIDNEVRG